MTSESFPQISPLQVRAERRAHWVYWWLFFSAFITVPLSIYDLRPVDNKVSANASWSPNGQQIVFVTGVGVYDDNAKIYVANADGEDPKHIANMGIDYPLNWSPDGTQIAFISVLEKLTVINSNGSGLRQLSDLPTTGGYWSPSGKQIAFTSNSEVYIVNVDNAELIRLTNHPSDDYFSGWSPDGTKIALGTNRDGNDEIYVINADGTALTRLTNDQEIDTVEAWSPDGKQIAFVSYRNGNFDIFVIDSDGRNLKQLTNTSRFEGYLSWSPNGELIAFLSDRDGDWEIYIMDSDGSNQTRLTGGLGDNCCYASWSPDGKRIAFGADGPDGGRYIYTMKANGADISRLSNTQDTGVEYQPIWSPDGQYILFTSERDVYIAKADGSVLTNATAPPDRNFIWALALPQLIHIVLLLGLVSPHIFLRRHTQQGLILVGLSSLITFLFLGLTGSEGYNRGLWIFVYGFVLIFGTLWGLRQASRGDCWLMRVARDQDELPRPWATIPAVSTLPKAREFAIGFIGWFVFDSVLLFGIFTFFLIGPGGPGSEVIFAILAGFFCLLVNVVAIIILAIFRRWIAIGSLAAFATNLALWLIISPDYYLPGIPFYILWLPIW